MLAFGRERRIENCGNSYVKMRRWREFAVFGGVEGAFEISDFRTDVDPAGEGVKKPFSRIECGEIRETAEGEMNFGNGACGANVANAKREGGIELGGIEEREKSALGIDAGNDSFNGDFFAIGK